MRFHRAQPPPLVRGALGADATVVGAAEVAFATVLTKDSVTEWSSQA